MIRLENISKRFGRVQANQGIDLSIEAGRITALLGENGAGKSTLMSILAGRLQPDEGRILIDGAPVGRLTARAAIEAGIGMVYQHFMLVDAMTVTENLFLSQGRQAWLRPSRMAARVRRLAERYGLALNPLARVGDLSMGEKQRVEILKLLQRDSRVLIFDEPTAVLTPGEAESLFTALRQMAGQGKAIVFISHKLPEVMALADSVTILRRGRVVDDLPIECVHDQADLARRMVGREVLCDIDREPVTIRQQVLRVEDLSGTVCKGVSLDLRQGEILGIVGVAGNGQKDLVETVCGLRPPDGGRVTIMGRSWGDFFGGPSPAGNLSYIPEDRRGLATCLGLDLVDNFLLTARTHFTRGPWLRRAPAAEKTSELIAAFDIQPPDRTALARQLSGGNLQKMVLAREFFRTPRLIVAEQPTQGLDIGAMEEVWRVLLKARERAGILLVTGDLSEALTLSDRIAVMYAGRVMDTFATHDSERVDRIPQLMAGIAPSQLSY